MTNLTNYSDDPWLDLSDAADILGIHYTTLRRWADDGQVPHYRTPGGRRRFKQSELTAFLQTMHEGEIAETRSVVPLDTPSVGARIAHAGAAGEPWYGKFDESQRLSLRDEGRQMMAVLMQYATRSNGGEVFIQEGRRMAVDYGLMCRRAGLSLVETAKAFVRVRRSIMDSVYEAGSLAGSPDTDTWRLYDRMNTFLDSMLLATLEAFDQSGS
ncbi:MAG: helix-turn-helix domain-containing protein [Caldilineales bacterium]